MSSVEVPDMPKATMEDGRSFKSFSDTPATESRTTTESAPQSSTPVYIADPIAYLSRPGHLGTRQDIEAELDVIAVAIRAFHMKQPDQVMREVAAFSARLTELCVLLHRVETLDRQYIRIRTQQVERFLAELKQQYLIASRLVEVQRQDLELMR